MPLTGASLNHSACVSFSFCASIHIFSKKRNASKLQGTCAPERKSACFSEEKEADPKVMFHDLLGQPYRWMVPTGLSYEESRLGTFI